MNDLNDELVQFYSHFRRNNSFIFVNNCYCCIIQGGDDVISDSFVQVAMSVPKEAAALDELLQHMENFNVTVPSCITNIIWSYVVGWDKFCSGSEWEEKDHVHTPYVKRKTARQLQKQREKNIKRKQRKAHLF